MGTKAEKQAEQQAAQPVVAGEGLEVSVDEREPQPVVLVHSLVAFPVTLQGATKVLRLAPHGSVMLYEQPSAQIRNLQANGWISVMAAR